MKMKKLTVKRKLNEVTEVDVAKFQKDEGLTLPAFLIEFFLSYGGAKVVENIYKGEYVTSFFLPLYSSINPSAALILPAVRDPEEGVGRFDIIPFAIDSGGSPFYVSIGEYDYTKVYFYRLWSGEENALLAIADSFEEFINGLRSEE